MVTATPFCAGRADSPQKGAAYQAPVAPWACTRAGVVVVTAAETALPSKLNARTRYEYAVAGLAVRSVSVVELGTSSATTAYVPATPPTTGARSSWYLTSLCELSVNVTVTELGVVESMAAAVGAAVTGVIWDDSADVG